MNPRVAQAAYLKSLEARNLSKAYVRTERTVTTILLRFVAGLSPDMPRREHLVAYRDWVGAYRRANGTSLAGTTVARYLQGALNFCRWLYRHGYVNEDPGEGLGGIVWVRNQARPVPLSCEMIGLLDALDDLREQAIFELLYSTGMRSGELAALLAADVKLEERLILVRLGKGKKDRYVPFGTRAQACLMAWMSRERGGWAARFPERERVKLFPGLQRTQIVRMWQGALREAGLADRGYRLHSIRHACATHMLEGGADIRYVQELLGHECLSTTQRYTRLSQERMKAVYRTWHPRDNEFHAEMDEAYIQGLRTLCAQIEAGRAVRRLRAKNQGKPCVLEM